ncbi:hypothetical protein [uncultured Tenacibaculum sp.]|uniref:hypothetical protein n=1 Tax=uncultured Tenacibaculum sp. TaxID=174713 RepID=UPI0026351908|nr:hypothetical protein [uncultured Tenacibaculum sp.]
MKNKNLQGKWLIRDISHNNMKKGFPGFWLFEIEEEKVIFYRDFSLKKPEFQLKLGNLCFLTLKDEVSHEFTVVNENQIIIYSEGKYNDKEVTFESNYDRLLPTKTNLTKEEIEAITYVMKINNNKREQVFSFSKKFNSETKSFFAIEEIDKTLFLCSYFSGMKNASLAIKEITMDSIKLYPTSIFEIEITRYKKK